jgi:hypothetical protein
MSPPKKRKGRPQARSSKPQLARACQLLRAFQRPFGWVFWALEQRIAELDVEIERRGREHTD